MGIPPYIARLRERIGTDLLMVTAADALVYDDEGRLLLMQRRDNGLWNIPGGIVDPGEPPARALVREVREETGLLVVPDRLVAVKGGEVCRLIYPNGDQVEFIVMTFVCRAVGGELGPGDDETIAVGYFSVDALPPLYGDSVPELARLATAGGPTAFEWDPAWLPAPDDRSAR